MSIDHPITPPPELVEQWYKECPEANEASLPFVATQAARWGADQELEACCADLRMAFSEARSGWLRSARRPKPPSLAEQALELVDRIEKAESVWYMHELDTIRRALKQLKELEQQENNDN